MEDLFHLTITFKKSLKKSLFKSLDKLFLKV